MFAQVVFPLPFRNEFTYEVPPELTDDVKLGVRVVVPFSRRILTGFVVGISNSSGDTKKIKKVYEVLDTQPIFNEQDLEFYKWLSEYYISSLGEALKFCVPAGLEVESKKKVIADQDLCEEILIRLKNKTTIKGQLLQLFTEFDSYSVKQLQKILERKNISSALKSLENVGAITIINEIEEASLRKKTLKFVKLATDIETVYEKLPLLEKRSPKQVVLLLELISSKKEDYQLSELLKKTEASASSVDSLESKGLVIVFDKEMERIYDSSYSENIKSFELTKVQKSIVKTIQPKISKPEFAPFLLYGVTGSGKTQVYIELAKKAIEIDRTVLILVPEISLTPQITSRFINTFGDVVTVIHSKMSNGERYDSWRGILKGKYKVVVGARSALFSPLKNLGLIVVDEEHDSSYKQFENLPRYNARDAALMKASLVKCPIVLGSATPSIESMYNAKHGKYSLLEMKERVDNARLPEINLVDITLERKKKRMANIFSQVMINKIAEVLEKKEGVIILQNRRGFATQVFCEDCGEIDTCNNCSVPMVHHIDKNVMRCHYCAAARPVPKACTNCGSLALKFFGVGTQRVEDELEYHFSEAKIERVDSDSMSKRGELGQILNRFSNGEIDILVGTQMVSKGLDFSNVTLVGVVSAEATLWLPDFRADERTFQLLTQVSGRAGRSRKSGSVLIQTHDHKHFVLQQVVHNNYEAFYDKEIRLRHEGGYPPFTRLCLIETKDSNNLNAMNASKDFHKYLIEQKKPILIAPTVEASIAKLKGDYRYHIMIKSNKQIDPSGKVLRESVLNALIKFNRESRYRNVKLYIDIDPQNVI